jgi:TPR repeat protein
MHRALQNLNFEVNVGRNMTSAAMYDFIKQNITDTQLAAECVFVYFSGHGNSKGILGSDDETLALGDLASLLRPPQARQLVDVPKLVFIDACRGRQRDDGASKSTESFPSTADFLFGYATAPDHVAYDGRYARVLASGLEEHWRNTEITEVLTWVQRTVATVGSSKQMANFHSFLTKKLVYSGRLAGAAAAAAPHSSQAEEWFQKGYSFAYGTGGVAKDEREAVKWYRLAADQGHVRAQFYLGVCYYSGAGVAKDEREAVKWYRLAAEQGDFGAQFNLSTRYAKGIGVAKDEREAVKWLRLAADQGFVLALSKLGECYYNGAGVAKDECEAVKWFRLAADQGRARARFNLGVCYRSGTGVAKDEREAVKWFRLAADQGYADAQFNLGVCYRHGTGVLTDYREGVKWLRLAADQGHAVARFNLGQCYEHGFGVAKDTREAVKWYRLAAVQGRADAQYNLALCYENGTGVAKDKREAVKWYRLAADQGSLNAVDMLVLMEM